MASKNNNNKKQNGKILLNSKIFIMFLGFAVTAIVLVKTLSINIKSYIDPNGHGQLTLNGPQQQLIQQQQQLLQQQQNHLQELQMQLESSSSSSSSSSGKRCIMHNNHLDNMLEKTPQLFIVMPAKAGGNSITKFATECSQVQYPDSILSQGQEDQMKQVVTESKHPARVVSNHIKTSEPLLNLIQYSSQQQTTIFYIYREETDRLISAIKYIVTARLCMPHTDRMFRLQNQDFGLEYNETSLTCKFDEEPFVKHIIQGNFMELSFSIYSTLTCDVWEEIKKNSPKIVFVHYKQLNHLQEKISKYYCPQVSPKTLNEGMIDEDSTDTSNTIDDNDQKIGTRSRRLKNVSHEEIIKKMTISVKRKDHAHEKEILFSDWLQERGSILEYGLHLFPPSQTQCRSKIRTMHESLEVCPMIELMPPTSLW